MTRLKLQLMQKQEEAITPSCKVHIPNGIRSIK